LLELAATGELASAAGRESPRVLLVSTEGATDPVSWERIVGHGPSAERSS
jgi:hypothetical protein